VHTPVVVRSDAKRGLVDTGLATAAGIDTSGYESFDLEARSADGTVVPCSVAAKIGLPRDGSSPTLLDGYGSYGASAEPYFSPSILGWIEQGGVFIEAHVRGGGDFGEEWHLAGKQATKQHTIDDFLACGRAAIEAKLTTPARLAGMGTSAGGITIGGAITQAPELFAAAIPRVGDTNSLRAELTPGGPANVPEFGTVKTEEGFKALLAMDAYQHVKDGVAYPAVLVTTGVNDPRVSAWIPAKFAARLQAATSSKKPILLYVDFDAGHGLGSTRDQAVAQKADEYSFLLWQLGHSAFQPR
jgi:prolyl oligopeptidase